MPPPSSSSNPNSKAPPKGIQFWILLVCSLGICALYFAEVVLSHDIVKEQHFLVDQREIADNGPYYKAAWQKIAVETWKVSQEDPSMLEYLKNEGVGVHQGPPPGSDASTNAAPAAPASTPAPSATP